MTADRLARIRDFYAIHDGEPYNSGNGRAVPATEDGNGMDCSGCQHAAFKYAWEPDPAPLPLTSTTGFALLAEHMGWWVDGQPPQEGDLCLYCETGDVFHSDGPIGHVEMYGETLPNGLWRCWGSSGGHGVGYRDRRPSFWNRRFRVPGLHDHSQPTLTPEQWAALARALEELDVEHGQAVDAVVAAGGRRITLSRGGELYARDGKGNPIVIVGTGYWPRQDVARKIVLAPLCARSRLAYLRGWVLDLDGGWHGFAQEGKSPPSNGKAPVYYQGGKIVAFDESR